MINEKGITATAKDIKKGLKEFREKHKDKNYNEYVNMYDENKKETFESYWNKNFKEYDDNNDEQMFNLTFRELKQLKQLHDTEINTLTERNEHLTEVNKELESQLNLDYDERVKKQLKEKDQEIKFLKENKDWDFKTIKRK